MWSHLLNSEKIIKYYLNFIDLTTFYQFMLSGGGVNPPAILPSF